MAAGTGQALVFRFGTDLEPARRSIQSFASSAGRNLALMGSTAIIAARNFEHLNQGANNTARALQFAIRAYTTYKLALLGGAAAVAVFAKAAQAASEAITEMRRIASGAATAGVSTSLFQVWEQQAGKLAIKVEDLRAALNKVKSSTEITVGDDGVRVEPAASKVLRNISQANNGLASGPLAIIENSADAETRLRAMVDALRQIHQEADRIGNDDLRLWADRLAQVAFGEKGKELSQAIREGRLELDGLIAGAEKAGSIFSAELIRKTEEYDRQLAAANDKLYREMVPVFQTLASIALDIKGGWVGVVDAIAESIARAKQLLTIAQQIRQSILNQIDPGLGLQDQVGYFKSLGMVLQTAVKVLQRGPEAPAPAGSPYGTLGVGNPAIRFDQADPYLRARLIAAQRDQQRNLFARSSEPTTGRTPRSASGSTVDEVANFLKSLERTVEVLEAEAAAYGKSAVEKEKATQMARAEAAARERGTALTEEEIRKTEQLAERRARAREETKRLQLAEQRARETAQFFGNQLIDAFDRLARPGAKLKDVIEDITRALYRASLQALILGQGPLAQILGMAAPTSGGVGGLFGALGSAFGGKMFGAPLGAGSGATVSAGVFASGGWADRPAHVAHIPAAAFRNAPAFAMGGAIPALLHPGEVILNAAQQRNVADRMGGPSVRIENYGQVGLVDVAQTASRDFVVTVAKQEAQRAVGVNNRHIRSVMSERQMREFR